MHNAVVLTQVLDHSMTVSVPDRDGDTNSEPITYSWSGTAGNPLLRVLNNGSAETIAEDVHDFQVTHHTPSSGKEYIEISIQVSSSSHARVESAFALINQ